MHIHSTTYTDIARCMSDAGLDVVMLARTGHDRVTAIGVPEFDGDNLRAMEWTFINTDCLGEAPQENDAVHSGGHTHPNIATAIASVTRQVNNYTF